MAGKGRFEPGRHRAGAREPEAFTGGSAAATATTRRGQHTDLLRIHRWRSARGLVTATAQRSEVARLIEATGLRFSADDRGEPGPTAGVEYGTMPPRAAGGRTNAQALACLPDDGDTLALTSGRAEERRTEKLKQLNEIPEPMAHGRSTSACQRAKATSIDYEGH